MGSTKSSSIFTPLPALETGLMPEGSEVISDDLEADIDTSKLDFIAPFAEALRWPPIQDDVRWVGAETVVAWALALNIYGSLGFGKIVIDQQVKGINIIPVTLRGNVIPLPRTILYCRGLRSMGCLIWNGRRLVIDFDPLVGTIFGCRSRLACAQITN